MLKPSRLPPVKVTHDAGTPEIVVVILQVPEPTKVDHALKALGLIAGVVLAWSIFDAAAAIRTLAGVVAVK